MNGKPIAFFDFDGTLTNGDTLMPFLRYVVGARTYYYRLIMVSPMLAGYFLNLIRNDIAKQAVIETYLKGYQLEDLKRNGRLFAQEHIPLMLRPEVMERLSWHRAQGHVCVLVSASLNVYLEPWARISGFDHVLCSQVDHHNGRVTGKIRGVNCYGQEKVNQIKRLLKNRAPTVTYGYGDSCGDQFMLRYVDHGFLLSRGRLLPFFAPEESK